MGAAAGFIVVIQHHIVAHLDERGREAIARATRRIHNHTKEQRLSELPNEQSVVEVMEELSGLSRVLEEFAVKTSENASARNHVKIPSVFDPTICRAASIKSADGGHGFPEPSIAALLDTA